MLVLRRVTTIPTDYTLQDRDHDAGSTISTLLHDRINPKDCQVLSLGDTGFLQFFRVVSRDDKANPVMGLWKLASMATGPVDRGFVYTYLECRTLPTSTFQRLVFVDALFQTLKVWYRYHYLPTFG